MGNPPPSPPLLFGGGIRLPDIIYFVEISPIPLGSQVEFRHVRLYPLRIEMAPVGAIFTV